MHVLNSLAVHLLEVAAVVHGLPAAFCAPGLHSAVGVRGENKELCVRTLVTAASAPPGLRTGLVLVEVVVLVVGSDPPTSSESHWHVTSRQRLGQGRASVTFQVY